MSAMIFAAACTIVESISVKRSAIRNLLPKHIVLSLPTWSTPVLAGRHLLMPSIVTDRRAKNPFRIASKHARRSCHVDIHVQKDATKVHVRHAWRR